MRQDTNHIIMIASENGALKSGKVGGLADVIRDLPIALGNAGWNVTVVIPSYGFLHKVNPSEVAAKIVFPFGGKTMEGELWHVTPTQLHDRVTHFVFEHPEIRGTPIYSNDPPDQPYAQDATKYSLFCSAVGQWIKTIEIFPILHLHDWHTGALLLLRGIHPDFHHLKKYKFVFTIHNLAFHGNRPLRGTKATIEQWFPELFYSTTWIDIWKDHRYKDANFNPLMAGIRYADKINTVSPTYAEEILKPSDHGNGFYGGEGLEEYLQQAKQENRLFGILNGIEYPPNRPVPRMSFSVLCDLIISEIKKIPKQKSELFFSQVLERIERAKLSNSNLLLTSITRVTEQKVRLLFEQGSQNKTALEEILQLLEVHNGYFFLIGDGVNVYEQKLINAFHQNERLIYLKIYSESLAASVYASGTMFLMPSSFEPCGISQMLAMRDGQPCIVNAVGGLKDTVIDGVNGFLFSGENITEQVDSFVAKTKRAVDIYLNDKPRWEKIKSAASCSRFLWDVSAKQYIESLYR